MTEKKIDYVRSKEEKWKKELEEMAKRRQKIDENWANRRRWYSAIPHFHPVGKQHSSTEEFKKAVAEDSKKREEDAALARAKRPRLYVDPKVFALERAVLARNLLIDDSSIGGKIGIRERIVSRNLMTDNFFRSTDFEKVVDALFNFYSLSALGTNEEGKEVPPEECPRAEELGAYLWLICHQKEIINDVNSEINWLEEHKLDSRWEDMDTKRLDLLHYLIDQFSKFSGGLSLDENIKTLFMEMFPTEYSPTCMVKYNVIRHPKDDNLRCIQYFFYWPIQVFPYHIFDYEPIYVYVYKLNDGRFATILVLFNSVSNLRYSLKTLFRYRKRPGHLIRVFFNKSTDFVSEKSVEYLDREIPFWNFDDPKESREYYRVPYTERRKYTDNNLSFNFDDYYKLGEFMTKAYGGQYVYEKKPKDFKERTVKELIDEDRYVAFYVPVFWHAFDLCSKKITSKKDWLVNYTLRPLNSRDWLHIEWNICQPFQAPFLYPLVGGKNPLMHYPLDVLDLTNMSANPKNWRFFCANQWDRGNCRVMHIYRLGKLIEFLAMRNCNDQETVKELWSRIENYDKKLTILSESKLFWEWSSYRYKKYRAEMN